MTFDDLNQWLIDYAAAYPQKYRELAVWRKPITACAPVDDRFQRLKEITVPEHALPQDLLPTAKSVVAWFVPFKRHLQRDNIRGGRPALSWGRAYLSTNEMIERTGHAIKKMIEDLGGKVVLTPSTHNFDQKRLVSLWSHKHLGHLIGLGRYGTHCQLITPKGCSGRLGSLVTDLDLGDHPLVTADELCLLKAGKKCGKCIKPCPVEALTANGMDRRVCYDRLQDNYQLLMQPDGLPGSTEVCAKCQVGMPCSIKSPLPIA